MREIDIEPRKHSSSYELKPWSRWWLLVPVVGVLLGAYVNGIASIYTWGLVFFGMMLMAFLILVFPHYWLSRRD